MNHCNAAIGRSTLTHRCLTLLLLVRLPLLCCTSPRSRSALIPEYIWRMYSWRQMDFDFAASQMVDLLLRPSEVSKTTRIRKQIKNQWARDDPAFVLLLGGIILATTLAYAVCFQAWNPLHLVRLLIGGLVFEYLLCGAAIATALRLYVNAHMRIQRVHAVEQSVEWLYAFDVHCNALLVAFLLVAPAQYGLIPVVAVAAPAAPSLFATVLANTLWLAGLALYSYITFLGYSALPFIHRHERLFHPMGAALLLYLLLLLLNFNVSTFFLDVYFGHSHREGLQGKIDDALAMEIGTPGR